MMKRRWILPFNTVLLLSVHYATSCERLLARSRFSGAVSHAPAARLIYFPAYCNTPGSNEIPHGVTLPCCTLFPARQSLVGILPLMQSVRSRGSFEMVHTALTCPSTRPIMTTAKTPVTLHWTSAGRCVSARLDRCTLKHQVNTVHCYVFPVTSGCLYGTLIMLLTCY